MSPKEMRKRVEDGQFTNVEPDESCDAPMKQCCDPEAGGSGLYNDERERELYYDLAEYIAKRTLATFYRGYTGGLACAATGEPYSDAYVYQKAETLGLLACLVKYYAQGYRIGYGAYSDPQEAARYADQYARELGGECMTAVGSGGPSATTGHVYPSASDGVY